MKYNDNELVYYINDGNRDDAKIMYEKYYPYIKSISTKISRAYKNIGLEEEDIHQECIIGLMNAIETYDENKDNIFFTYAKACIEKRIISMLVASNRSKHRILNESVQIDETNISLFKTESSYEKLMGIEDENRLLIKIRNNLTDFEDQILQLKLSGVNNIEICDILNSTTKSIENAMYRIRIKVKKIIGEL